MNYLPGPGDVTVAEAVDIINQRRSELVEALPKQDAATLLALGDEVIRWAEQVVEKQSDPPAAVPLSASIAAFSGDLALLAVMTGQAGLAYTYAGQAATAISSLQKNLGNYEASLVPCQHGAMTYRGKCTPDCPKPS